MPSKLLNPFLSDDPRVYTDWRARKLAMRPTSAADLVVGISNATSVSENERAAVLNIVRRANMAIFVSGDGSIGKDHLRIFGEQFGLRRLDANLYADEDSITSLQVSDRERKREYIPYTNQRLNWHTDGYYNPPSQWIRAFLLYCAQDAAEGGDNQLLDHEIAYILLRDADPRFIEALMHPAAMTIPANIEQGVEIRAAESGPVFSVDPLTGNLHMRYSARTRNIQWRDDPATLAAVQFLQNLWDEGSDYVYHYRLMPGEGLICNNVLHNRTAFRDDPTPGPTPGKRRLMYRARYFDRIAATDINLSDLHDQRGLAC